tara:strand:+ start:402 stop:599 length:198 start_codon:yes stop_codon:yes gene_type:complete
MTDRTCGFGQHSKAMSDWRSISIEPHRFMFQKHCGYWTPRRLVFFQARTWVCDLPMSSLAAMSEQ